MTALNRVWIVDDDRSIRWVLSRALKGAGIACDEFESGREVVKAIESDQPRVIITDIRMPGMDGFELLRHLNDAVPEVPVIITTAHAGLESAVSAFQSGAFEYLPKPFDIDDAIELVERALSQGESAQPDPNVDMQGQTEIIGSAPLMQEVFRAIGRLSKSSINVLITGESGTGKELIASALHRHSPRADKPFIALNMAAITRDLLESELFGHEKGAFTGAQTARQGRFEQANNGTLFLDEIGDMPAELQTRLLRVLAEGEFYRVGGHAPIQVDVRVIAATHKDLEEEVAEGEFREDLFHRLNVVRIRVPALRERSEDIPALLEHFLSRAAGELDAERKSLNPEALEILGEFGWPGNVRQLENIARWLTVMTPSHRVHAEDLPPEVLNDSGVRPEIDWQQALRGWANQRLMSGSSALMDEALPAFEKVMISAALERTGGRRQDAAALLGWGRNTITRKIRDLHMDDA
ncbi:MAG: nitrogen regulation protein NR(I) [Gammaproteobacteria bacterium]|nr:MAG: nitrogen regulation protein NR(I) [Gammaproteobacteria bacterium]RLA14652.1 MAG: nitrogen regulation protein NR(I) [Gammaproteobacteria bacterium]RLA17671.1 MAG: nitrogen regulation protein NR(I) [Gammaproteobacteria bacterium]